MKSPNICRIISDGIIILGIIIFSISLLAFGVEPIPTLHTGRDYPLERLHIWAAYHTLPFLPAPFTMEDTLDFLLSSLW